MPRYLVAYAKLRLEGEGGVTLIDTYFGDYAENFELAEAKARAVVNAHCGAARSTILPRVIELADTETIVDGLYTATEKFESLVVRMNEANYIIEYAERQR